LNCEQKAHEAHLCEVKNRHEFHEFHEKDHLTIAPKSQCSVASLLEVAVVTTPTHDFFMRMESNNCLGSGWLRVKASGKPFSEQLESRCFKVAPATLLQLCIALEDH